MGWCFNVDDDDVDKKGKCRELASESPLVECFRPLLHVRVVVILHTGKEDEVC